MNLTSQTRRRTTTIVCESRVTMRAHIHESDDAIFVTTHDHWCSHEIRRNEVPVATELPVCRYEVPTGSKKFGQFALEKSRR
jgi:hypothetical protein